MVMDHLGKYSKNKTLLKCYLCGSSLNFLKEVQNILITNNIKCCLSKVKQSKRTVINNKDITRRSDHWRVDTQNTHTQNLLRWIYYPDHKLSMLRKSKIAQEIINTIINPRGRKPNIEKRNLAKKLRTAGLTLREIAKELKTSNSQIHLWTNI